MRALHHQASKHRLHLFRTQVWQTANLRKDPLMFLQCLDEKAEKFIQKVCFVQEYIRGERRFLTETIPEKRQNVVIREIEFFKRRGFESLLEKA